MEPKQDEKKELVWKTTSAVTKAEGGRKYTFTFSSSEVDRGNDVVEQAGIDLTNFKKNPVVLWAHSYWTPPIGRVPALWFRDGKLQGTIEFPPEGISALADEVEGLVREGFIQACSIGFSPIEWTYDEERRGINFKRVELYELSLCPVGANRDALREAAAKGVKVDSLVSWAKEILVETQPYVPPASKLESEVKVKLEGLTELEAFTKGLEAFTGSVDKLAQLADTVTTQNGKTFVVPDGHELIAVGDMVSIRQKEAPPDPPQQRQTISRADILKATQEGLRELVREGINRHTGRLDD